MVEQLWGYHLLNTKHTVPNSKAIANIPSQVPNTPSETQNTSLDRVRPASGIVEGWMVEQLQGYHLLKIKCPYIYVWQDMVADFSESQNVSPDINWQAWRLALISPEFCLISCLLSTFASGFRFVNLTTSSTVISISMLLPIWFQFGSLSASSTMISATLSMSSSFHDIVWQRGMSKRLGSYKN